MTTCPPDWLTIPELQAHYGLTREAARKITMLLPHQFKQRSRAVSHALMAQVMLNVGGQVKVLELVLKQHDTAESFMAWFHNGITGAAVEAEPDLPEPEVTGETALIPFHGAALRTMKEGDTVWVAVRPICEHLGLHITTQMDKLTADERFSCAVIRTTAADGKDYSMVALPHDQLLGWLYTINPNKVSDSARPLLLTYQRETTGAINDYWTKGYASRTPEGDFVGMGFLKHFAGQVHTAIQQEVAGVRDEVAQVKEEFHALTQVLPITSPQINAIHKSVEELARRMGGKAAHYRKAWRLFKDRFGVASYRDLPGGQFDEAMDFLNKLLSAYVGHPKLEFDEPGAKA